MTEIARVPSPGLAPLSADLGLEVFAWATELRALFAATVLSISRFVRLHPHIDKGTVSRYLSGKRVPRDKWFLETLLSVQADVGKATTSEVRGHLTGLQLDALLTAHPHEYKIRIISDDLETAVTGQREAERYARGIEERLAERGRRIQELDADLRRLRAAWDDDRAGTRAEHDRLAREIADLTEQLRWARERAIQSEHRCQHLEDLIDRLDVQPPTGPDHLTASASPDNRTASADLVNDAYTIAKVLDGLRQAGADTEFAELAERAAQRASVHDMSDVVVLLRSLRRAGADKQFVRLAERVVTDAALRRPSSVAVLLRELATASADAQINGLLALDEPAAVAELLDSLCEMGADHYAAALTARAAAQPPSEGQIALGTLLRLMRKTEERPQASGTLTTTRH